MNPYKTEHSLALKVMRLTSPTLIDPYLVLSCEAKDIPRTTFQQTPHYDAMSEHLNVGQFMLLPQSFGNIYLGETFVSYICVHNCATNNVEGVTLKINLQSNTSRIHLPMFENEEFPTKLAPDQTLDGIVRYEVKEIGTHILVCEINYTTSAGFPQYFRKFFKFQVMKPLDVQTKFYNDEIDEIYLEAQIRNITAIPFCLEKVDFVPIEQYMIIPLNCLTNGESVFSAKQMLPSNSSCQFLYYVKPKFMALKGANTYNFHNAVGKLDIVWRSSLGEKGRLQTSQLQRLPVEHKNIQLELIEARNIVKVNTSFKFVCRVINTSDRCLNLNVELNAKVHKNCNFTGSSAFSLDSLHPGKSKEFSLIVFPTRLGNIKVLPIIFTDVLLQEQYIFEKLVEIFVVSKDYHEKETFHTKTFLFYDNLTSVSNAKEVIPV